MGAMPPSAGGPFASLGFMGGRKPFEGPGSPLVPTKLPTSFLQQEHHAHLLPGLINRHREPAHPLLPQLRPPFIHPSLYPALASLSTSSAPGYPASMASFHSVLASLSAYRPGLGGHEAPDYASLLRSAGAVSPGPPPSPSSTAEAKARLDSANELRIKAREFELKLEQESKASEV